jgi:hypothetical protein
MIDIGPPDIRRLPGGAIDTAYYVLKAQRARACATAALFRKIGRWLRRTATARPPDRPAPPRTRSCLGTEDAAL